MLSRKAVSYQETLSEYEPISSLIETIQARFNDFDKNQFTSEYRSLFQKPITPGAATSIAHKDYAKGYTIFKWCISEGIRKDYVSLGRRGQTRLSFHFAKPLPEPVTVVCYAKFAHDLQIDKARNVII